MADPYRQRVRESCSSMGFLWGVATQPRSKNVLSSVVSLSPPTSCCLPTTINKQQQDNPFADSTLYELNTTYVPPDLSETTVDAVVPAIPTAGGVGAVPSSQQPAAAGGPPAYRSPVPTPPAVAGPAVPAAGGTVPALPFTGACVGGVCSSVLLCMYA